MLGVWAALPPLSRAFAIPLPYPRHALSAALRSAMLRFSPRGSAAPLCARLRLYPAPLMHREDNGAAHSWDITKYMVSQKENRSLSFFERRERLVAKTLKPFLDLSAVRAHFVAVDTKAFLHVSVGVRTTYIGHGIR